MRFHCVAAAFCSLLIGFAGSALAEPKTAAERIFGDTAVPYPFEKIVEHMRTSTSPVVTSTFFPLGRTEENTSAGENLFKEPNVVVSFAGRSIGDQIYVHYSPASKRINVMLFNEAQAKYDFFEVTGYGEVAEPKLAPVAADNCVSCHQGAKPIYSDSWSSESPWRDFDVPTRLIVAANSNARKIYGLEPVPFKGGTYELMSQIQWYDHEPSQKIWSNVCAGKTEEQGIVCRGNFLKTVVAKMTGVNFRANWPMYDVPTITWHEFAAGGQKSVSSVATTLPKFELDLDLTQEEYDRIKSGASPEEIRAMANRALALVPKMTPAQDPRTPRAEVSEGFAYKRAVADWADSFTRAIFSSKLRSDIIIKHAPKDWRKLTHGEGYISFNQEAQKWVGYLIWDVSSGTDLRKGYSSCEFDDKGQPVVCDLTDLHDFYGNPTKGKMQFRFNTKDTTTTHLSAITLNGENPEVELVCYLDATFDAPASVDQKHAFTCGKYDFRKISQRIDKEIERNLSGNSSSLRAGPIQASYFAKMLIE